MRAEEFDGAHPEALRQAFDRYGNAVGLRDANNRQIDVTYDALSHTFPVLERLQMGGGRSLSYAAAYHPGFGTVTQATDSIRRGSMTTSKAIADQAASSDQVLKSAGQLSRELAGIGRALTEQCILFAKDAGYSSITLWTQSNLLAARKIYQDAGFKLVASEPHRSFGQSLIGETWEREL